MWKRTPCTRLIWSRFFAGLFFFCSHLTCARVHKMREELCEDTLAYDMEFE
jgi:hypothetical protein